MHKIYKNWKKALCILEGVIRRGSDCKLQIDRTKGRLGCLVENRTAPQKFVRRPCLKQGIRKMGKRAVILTAHIGR